MTQNGDDRGTDSCSEDENDEYAHDIEKGCLSLRCLSRSIEARTGTGSEVAREWCEGCDTLLATSM